jgi:hypothetical protein
VINGSFSKRWFEIAQILGLDAVALKKPFGEAPTPQEIDRALSEQGPFDALTLISNETSTGVRHPARAGRCRDAQASQDPVAARRRQLPSPARRSTSTRMAARLRASRARRKLLALPPGITVIVRLAPLRRARAAGQAPELLPRRDPHPSTATSERKTPATPCIPACTSRSPKHARGHLQTASTLQQAEHHLAAARRLGARASPNTRACSAWRKSGPERYGASSTCPRPELRSADRGLPSATARST